LAEYNNPQHEPGNERRLLLVFLVTFVVMLLFEPLFKKYFPQPAQAPHEQSHAAQPAQPAPRSPAASEPAVNVSPGVTHQAASEGETVIESDLYRITFTNKGAQVKSWILKKFDNEAQNGRLDLVNPAGAAQYGYPLSLWTYDETLRNKLNSVLYVAEGGKSDSETSRPSSAETLAAGHTLTAPATITFEYSDQDLAVRKTFTFGHTYVVNVETSVTVKGQPVSALPAWPAGFGDQVTVPFYVRGLVDYQFNKNVARVAIKKISSGATINGPFQWAGPTDQYFAAVFIPDDPSAVSMVTLRNSITVPRDPAKPDAEKTPVDVLGAAVGNLHGPTVERLFVGPKELSILQKVNVPGISGADRDLTGLVDFGWWGLIAKPLFIWLRWTYQHMVPNWGWAIVVQTFIITLALMPLRFSQMKSMFKMQRIQPQIKSIQEKYKKYSLRDPRKAAMNEEISALYKKEGVNPVGGCLPMLPQLPIIYAYYRMLDTALDLRHAHWLWIHDLSAAEPVPFILPILLVVTQMFTQRMTPQAGMDPKQQKMMNTMMPLVMGFIFFRLAAGVNLYYVVVNILSVAQQSIINRTKLGREMRELMEKRARKKDK
jgi:YidC/Oxa1 family membrane protein insertase